MQQKTKKWLSLVLAVLLVSACFTGTLLVRAAQDVAIDESHFPDAGFRQIVAEKCDKNGDGILSDSERSSITRMMLPAVAGGCAGGRYPHCQPGGHTVFL